jgi:hypothetical protein
MAREAIPLVPNLSRCGWGYQAAPEMKLAKVDPLVHRVQAEAYLFRRSEILHV